MAQRAILASLSTELSQLRYQSCMPLGVGVPGEYRPAAYRRIIAELGREADPSRSVFLDIGFGLGKAVFVAALSGRFAKSVGIEIAEGLPAMAEATAERFGVQGTLFLRADGAQYLPPDATHIYSFNLGMPPAVLEAMAQRLNGLQWECLVSSQTPEAWRRLGLKFSGPPEHPITRLCMSGSGRQYCMHRLTRRPPPPSDSVPELLLPATAL